MNHAPHVVMVSKRLLLTLLCCAAILCCADAQTTSPQPTATPCTTTVFPIAGTFVRTMGHVRSGLVLSGGGLLQAPTHSVLAWIRARVPGSGRAGNLVVLRASGGRDYSDEFYKQSRLASVQEILIPPCAVRSEVDRAAPYVERADAVLFSGGDQANYVKWKGSRLVAAVRRAYSHAVIGGGSAGLAIQGEIVFDSVSDDRLSDKDVATPDAVKDPYEPTISFTTGFFSWPPMRNSMTDTHFARRNRFGRLAAFMARALHDHLVAGRTMYGVAVDEGAALLVEPDGTATLTQRVRGSDGYVPKGAYLLEGKRPGDLARGKPLRYSVRVSHLWRSGQRYQLLQHRGDGEHYSVTVDGGTPSMYSRNPYIK
ncbi:MAG: hypothetical protein GIW98_07405 [Candidatus Eremiobacteraeota bacterium]|nr:hypothetical protein [Candidatus Eremiobacteraeota bacterium]